MIRLIRYIIPLLLLTILYDCKREEDPTFFVTASVSNSSEGTVTFNSGDYAEGASVTFTANPKEGYTFTNWVNTQTNQTYTNNPLNISIDGNTTLVANFERSAYKINVEISGQGEVQKTLVGGGTDFVHGSNIELTAVPSENHSFFYWNNDPTDTENPKRLVLESDQNLQAKFDFQVARDLVGTWEFQISDPTSKNVTIIQMSIDIFLNVLMTTIINGNIESQIFSQMVAISSTAIVIGDFAVITNIAVESASRVSMNMIPLPESNNGPIIGVEIPEEPEAQLDLSGDKVQNESEEYLDLDEQGLIIPPENAVTASSTTQDIGDVFDQSFDQLTDVQSPTISSNTLDTGTSTSTTSTSTTDTATSTTSTGTSSSTTTSGTTDTGTSSSTTSSGTTDTGTSSSTTSTPRITTPNNNLGTLTVTSTVNFHYTLILFDVTISYVDAGSCPFEVVKYHTENLPPGVSLVSGSLFCYERAISGTISDQDTGTYNYTITAYLGNDLSSATETLTLFGTIIVNSNNSGSGTSSSTTSSGTTDTGTSSSTTTTSTASNAQDCQILRAFSQGDQNQSVNQGSPIQNITYTLSVEGNNCTQNQLSLTDGMGMPNVSGLPPGVTASLSGNNLTISGTPSTQASGTYNFTVIVITVSLEPK